MGSLTKILPPTRSYPIPSSSTNIKVKFWIALQAVLGALRLYLSFSCLQYLPLGDALTIIFTEPLFTIVLSFILLKSSIGFIKIILGIGLLAGMTLSIQPPFLFGPKSKNNSSDLMQGNNFSIHCVGSNLGRVFFMFKVQFLGTNQRFEVWL